MNSVDLRESVSPAASLARLARLQPDRVALQFGERVTSYAGLVSRANRVAHGLLAEGVRSQARIGFIGRNSDGYFELLFGAMAANIVLVPVNWRLAVPEIAAILRDAGIERLFVGCGFAGLAGQLDLPGAICVIAMDAGGGHDDYAAWRDRQPDHDPAVVPEPDDTCVQIYTSGTTGLPKGVELTNRNSGAAMEASRSAGWGKLEPADVVLVCMPNSTSPAPSWD